MLYDLHWDHQNILKLNEKYYIALRGPRSFYNWYNWIIEIYNSGSRCGVSTSILMSDTKFEKEIKRILIKSVRISKGPYDIINHLLQICPNLELDLNHIYIIIGEFGYGM